MIAGVRATIRHFEIPARDFERASRFYRQVFGWSVEPLPWDGPPYARLRASAGEPPASPARLGIDGGLTTAEGPADQPLLVIHVEEATLEQALERITAAGGTLDLPPAQVADFGRFARFRDPEGNLLGLWQGR